MKTITVMYEGKEVSKKTAKTGITHVVLSIYKGERVISGMFRTQLGAEKRVMQGWNPAWTDHVVVAVE